MEWKSGTGNWETIQSGRVTATVKAEKGTYYRLEDDGKGHYKVRIFSVYDLIRDYFEGKELDKNMGGIVYLDQIQLEPKIGIDLKKGSV